MIRTTTHKLGVSNGDRPEDRAIERQIEREPMNFMRKELTMPAKERDTLAEQAIEHCLRLQDENRSLWNEIAKLKEQVTKLRLAVISGKADAA